MKLVQATWSCDRCGALMREPTMHLSLKAHGYQEFRFELCQPCMDRLWTEFLDGTGERTKEIQRRSPSFRTPQVVEDPFR